MRSGMDEDDLLSQIRDRAISQGESDRQRAEKSGRLGNFTTSGPEGKYGCPQEAYATWPNQVACGSYPEAPRDLRRQIGPWCQDGPESD